MSYVDRSETKVYSAGTIAGLGGGYALSRFIGAVAWVPTIVGVASFVLLKKVIDRNTAVIATLAALIAQASWFLLGAVLAPDRASDVIGDIVIDAILITAIFFKPGYVTAGLAILVNLAGIVIVGLNLSDAAGDPNALLSVEERAMIAHIIVRVIIVGAAAMIIIYKANPDLLPDEEEDETALEF